MSVQATLKVALKYSPGLTVEALAAMPAKESLRLPYVGRKVIAEARRQTRATKKEPL